MKFFSFGSRGPVVQILLLFSYGVLITLPSSLFFLFSGDGGTDGNVLARYGDLLLLVTFPMLALQPVLSARLGMLDRSFGLDTVYLFHKLMGMTAGTLLLVAAVFRTVSSPLASSWPDPAAASLLSAVVLTAFLYRQLRMSYEAWRRLHNVLVLLTLAAVFVLALLAVPAAGKTLMRIMLTFYFGAGSAAYLHHRVIGPLKRRRLLYRVDCVERETHNVWNLTLSAPEGAARFDFLPGQFQFLTFDQGAGEEHPFTISSSPTLPGVHTATIKESGDFTRGIGKVREGDLLAVQAPFGRFSYVLHPDEKELVFIAGGIGITPFMSMLRHMRDQAADQDVLLLYASMTEKDIVFKNELQELAAGAAPRLRVTHVLARPGAGWTGKSGRIDGSLIEQMVTGDLRAKAFYLCGPPPMMHALITTLIEKGVPSHRVRSERFAL